MRNIMENRKTVLKLGGDQNWKYNSASCLLDKWQLASTEEKEVGKRLFTPRNRSNESHNILLTQAGDYWLSTVLYLIIIAISTGAWSIKYKADRHLISVTIVTWMHLSFHAFPVCSAGQHLYPATYNCGHTCCLYWKYHKTGTCSNNSFSLCPNYNVKHILFSRESSMLMNVTCPCTP